MQSIRILFNGEASDIFFILIMVKVSQLGLAVTQLLLSFEVYTMRRKSFSLFPVYCTLIFVQLTAITYLYFIVKSANQLIFYLIITPKMRKNPGLSLIDKTIAQLISIFTSVRCPTCPQKLMLMFFLYKAERKRGQERSKREREGGK